MLPHSFVVLIPFDGLFVYLPLKYHVASFQEETFHLFLLDPFHLLQFHLDPLKTKLLSKWSKYKFFLLETLKSFMHSSLCSLFLNSESITWKYCFTILSTHQASAWSLCFKTLLKPTSSYITQIPFYKMTSLFWTSHHLWCHFQTT